jgi:hypothetical protein
MLLFIELGSTRTTVRKTIRILGVSLALLALVVFATGVVSDWNHNDFAKDARCPYCHVGHQAPNQQAASFCVTVLKPVASLSLLDEPVPATGPVFSHTSPRGPTSA